jgi:hypothetical protein
MARTVSIANLAQKLSFYAKNNFNVMLVGKHGIGKTSAIKQAWEENGLVIGKNALYFSGATIDAHTQLLGIPYKGVEYLTFMLPQYFAEDNVEAIFVDEYNRADKDTMNALMELIQFKSINGKKLNKLRFVWSAINPESDGYSVGDLDKAQADRFQSHLHLPYEADGAYFTRTYGDIGTIFCNWYNIKESIPENFRDDVSPRRLEYAIQVYLAGGDLNDVLPEQCNVKMLHEMLHGEEAMSKVELILNGEDFDVQEKDLITWFSDPNNISVLKSKYGVTLKWSEEARNLFVTSLADWNLEVCAELYKTNKDFKNEVDTVKKNGEEDVMHEFLKDLWDANGKLFVVNDKDVIEEVEETTTKKKTKKTSKSNKTV